MDLGLLFGFVATWALIIWSILLGGSLLGYFDLPSVLLVGLGSCTIIFITHPFKKIINAIRVCRRAFFPPKFDYPQLIEEMVGYAEAARRNGILSLESATQDLKDPFIIRSLRLAIDGNAPELIQQIITADIENAQDRHEVAKSTIDSMGKYAPALGMIGTLIGLVVMLMNMDDPKKIGPGMAVAILTTLYGALISNGICLPLSDRLAKLSDEEALYQTIIMQGVLAIQAGDNPRVVEMKLLTYLPSSQRKTRDEKAVIGSIGKDRKAA